MTLDKRLAALVAALDAREQDVELTTEQMEEQVAALVAFLRSDRFGLEHDVIPKLTGPHTGPGCQRCESNRDQQATVDFVSVIEHSRSSAIDFEPITEAEWRARGRWWPDTPTCVEQ